LSACQKGADAIAGAEIQGVWQVAMPYDQLRLAHGTFVQYLSRSHSTICPEEFTVKVDLEGRIRNVELSKTRPLLPLFEAIINSFDSINELPQGRGKVVITIDRGPAQQRTDASEESGPVTGFTIEDNGTGFTSVNFASFETTDSSRKLGRGGKGVGRLLWLKAFSRAEVESTYVENGLCRRRFFRFALPDGVSEATEAPALKQQPHTTIRLIGMKEAFQKHCPADLHRIGRHIMEHTLTRLLDPSSPLITLKDEYESVSINDLFTHEIAGSAQQASTSVKGQRIDTTTFRLRQSGDTKSRLHYTAHAREVRTESLSDHLPDLGAKLPTDSGPCVISCYVSAEVLDRHVNSERTSFTLPSEPLPLTPEEIAISDIRDSVITELREQLGAELDQLHETKLGQIRAYVSAKAPRYRHLLKANRTEIDRIPSGLTEEKLESELHRLNYHVESRTLQAAQELIRQTSADGQDYDRRLRETIDTVSDVGRSKLADYVCHRRIVLDLLNLTLQRKAGRKYALEDAVHGLIFPLRATSDDVPLDHQNLWVIDERLAYHEYLASDKPLESYDMVDADGKKRPDLAIFGSAFATVDSEPPFGSVVIVEFKRPMRESIPEDENPIAQILDYVRRIRSGEARDRNGRPITVGDSIPFYGYLVADLTEKIRTHAENAGLVPAPDRLGYFGYNQAARTYLEVISYDKLVSDAKKRNQSFFDRLQLPP
jgi:hypothetical protein